MQVNNVSGTVDLRNNFSYSVVMRDRLNQLYLEATEVIRVLKRSDDFNKDQMELVRLIGADIEASKEAFLGKEPKKAVKCAENAYNLLWAKLDQYETDRSSWTVFTRRKITNLIATLNSLSSFLDTFTFD